MKFLKIFADRFANDKRDHPDMTEHDHDLISIVEYILRPKNTRTEDETFKNLIIPSFFKQNGNVHEIKAALRKRVQDFAGLNTHFLDLASQYAALNQLDAPEKAKQSDTIKTALDALTHDDALRFYRYASFLDLAKAKKA